MTRHSTPVPSRCGAQLVLFWTAFQGPALAPLGARALARVRQVAVQAPAVAPLPQVPLEVEVPLFQVPLVVVEVRPLRTRVVAAVEHPPVGFIDDQALRV